jgi:predicted negative regulator of RcsB-dependent stress response
MATHLDLQEQEQLDELKAFWNQYGNLITWVLILVLGGIAAWNGWNWYQRDQAGKAAALFDEMDRAEQSGDAARASAVFDDIKQRYPRTVYAEQAGLQAARVEYRKGQVDAAKAALGWVAEHAIEDAYKATAHLTLAGVLADQKQYDAALKELDAVKSPAFAALVADRRGDVLMAQGKKDEAKTAYQAAWKGLDEKADYRRLVDAKLTALGAPPPAASAASATVAEAGS